MKFKSYSIKKQYKIIYFCILLLVVMLSFLSIRFTKKRVEEKMNSYIENYTNNFQVDMVHMYENMSAIMLNISLLPELREFIGSPYSSKSIENVNKLLDDFAIYTTLRPEILDISVVSKDINWSNYLDDETALELMDKIKNTHGIQSLGFMKSSFYSKKNKKYSMVFGQNIYSNKNRNSYEQFLGSIFIFVNPSKISFVNTDFYFDDSCILISDKNDIVYNLYGSKKECADVGKVYGSGKKNKNYLIRSSEDLISGYKIILGLNKTQYNKDMMRTISELLIIILISSIVMMSVMYLVLNNMVYPLNKFAKQMKKISEEPKKMPEKHMDSYGCQEIKILNETFYSVLAEKEKLANELNQTTIELYEAELKKNKAEQDFLRSQLNPHFLYNTLETIKNMYLEKKPDNIEKITNDLAKILRYNLKGDNIVPLSQEIDTVLAYVDIQNIRFKNKINLYYSMIDETEHMLIIRFLLQPLVENSIIHGFNNAKENGTIFIVSRIEEDKLIIVIQDDGQGIDKNTLKNIKEKQLSCNVDNNDKFSKNHIGLFNVNHRIKLVYGEEYGIDIESELGSGTKISIILPVNK